jgi:hypothetical protein
MGFLKEIILLNFSRYLAKKKSFTLEQLGGGGLRDMSEFNMRAMRAMAIGGDHMRMLELADMFHDDIQGQGIGECRAIVCVLNKGKPNQFGKAEFATTKKLMKFVHLLLLFRSRGLCAVFFY